MSSAPSWPPHRDVVKCNIKKKKLQTSAIVRNPVVEFYFVFSMAVFSSHMYHIKHSKHERMKIYLRDIDLLLKTNCFNHWSIDSHKNNKFVS